jgi:hypothetical protein
LCKYFTLCNISLQFRVHKCTLMPMLNYLRHISCLNFLWIFCVTGLLLAPLESIRSSDSLNDDTQFAVKDSSCCTTDESCCCSSDKQTIPEKQADVPWQQDSCCSDDPSSGNCDDESKGCDCTCQNIIPGIQPVVIAILIMLRPPVMQSRVFYPGEFLPLACESKGLFRPPVQNLS